MRAEHARGPLIQYWGEWGWIPVLGGRDRGVGWGRKLTGLVGCQRGVELGACKGLGVLDEVGGLLYEPFDGIDGLTKAGVEAITV